MRVHRVERQASSPGRGALGRAMPERWRFDWASVAAAAVVLVGSAVFVSRADSVETFYMVVHVVAATVWVGGGVALTIFAVRTTRARDERAISNLVAQVAKFGERLFTPASLLVLASGIALVEKADIGYGVFWIDFSLVVWAASFLAGLLFLKPRSDRVTALIAERGVRDEVTERALTGLLRVARFDTAMLVLVVVDMAAQPGF